MLICGIDPGLDGAIAFLRGAELVDVADMPVFVIRRGGKTKRQVDALGLAGVLGRDPLPGHAFVEQVGAMPGQGVTSMFGFGRSYGIILGVVAALGIPQTDVPPRRWQAAIGVPQGKDGARLRAGQLFPTHAPLFGRVKDSGRADAALIALHGYRTFGAIVSGSSP